MSTGQKLLFVASEAFPLIKTGGLADVAGSLPEVLRQQGMDVRLLLPAYADLLANLEAPPVHKVELQVAGQPVRVLECLLPGTALRTWLLEHPLFSERPGNPYHDAQGVAWPDNPERFLLFSRVAAHLGTRASALNWRPEILHCNDWHTGPAIALAKLELDCPRSVFTIHNLAHMGIFDRATFDRLGLPERFWQEHGLEYYGQFNFIKGGLVFADEITTVSPTYAQEICEAPGGMGLEGLLHHRREHLWGILNGIRRDVWNPAQDPALVQHYDSASLDKKALNRAALQREVGLRAQDDRPVLGFIGRLVEQKGLELMLPVLEDLLDSPAQIVILGAGEVRYQQHLQALAARRAGEFAVIVGYDESLAHRIEAGADIFMMPSLFEPCGLNQLYSLRYGTPPVVRSVGGLADTVIDASEAALGDGTATGFVFAEPAAGEFVGAMRRAIALWHDQDAWRALQRAGMAQDFSWQRSAERYQALYNGAIHS
ncbi:MAG: glycogen synthase GlgA [Halioglobus sp.]